MPIRYIRCYPADGEEFTEAHFHHREAELEAGRGEVAFAIEDALQGKAVGDNYTTGTVAGYILPRKGAEVNALLKSGETVAIGDELVSAGDGTLQARGSSGSGVTEWQTIAYAMEAETAAANVLIQVRVA